MATERGDKVLTPYGLELTQDCKTCPLRKDGYFCQLSPATLKVFDNSFISAYPTGAVLFVEGQVSRGAYMLCQGRVKLTMTALDGKTVIVRIAESGEILGLNAAVSGEPYEVTAETLQPCQMHFLNREKLSKLLREHHEASASTIRQLSINYRGACQEIRFLGLARSATEKLARFLLEWSAKGQPTKQGIRFRVDLTHEEIAQIVGLSRETVTRTLSEFKDRMLISMKGSTLFIRNKAALEKLSAS